MRNSQSKKEENRQRIVEVAGRLFRARGVDGVSVAEVMQAANMTHGGFYRHFVDKEELIEQAVAGVVDATHVADTDGVAAGDLRSVASCYLSTQHRDAPNDGCIFAALGSEMVRAPAGTRRVMTAAIERQIERLSAVSPGQSENDQRQAAIGSWSAMIGAVILSRISDDPQLSEEILARTLGWLVADPAKTRSDSPNTSNVPLTERG
jgi:TetR/AcrR family transcriptional repressor of nem operon